MADIEIGEAGLAVAAALHELEPASVHLAHAGIVVVHQQAEVMDATARMLGQKIGIGAGAGERLDQLDLHLPGVAESDAVAEIARPAEISLILTPNVLLDQKARHAEFLFEEAHRRMQVGHDIRDLKDAFSERAWY